MRRSLIKTAVNTFKVKPTEGDISFLAEDTNSCEEFVRETLASL